LLWIVEVLIGVGGTALIVMQAQVRPACAP
jgi:hypothetical protein